MGCCCCSRSYIYLLGSGGLSQSDGFCARSTIYCADSGRHGDVVFRPDPATHAHAVRVYTLCLTSASRLSQFASVLRTDSSASCHIISNVGGGRQWMTLQHLWVEMKSPAWVQTWLFFSLFFLNMSFRLIQFQFLTLFYLFYHPAVVLTDRDKTFNL